MEKLKVDGKFVDSKVDIAIVGAGAAGLYTAWRLLQSQKYKNKRICIFDAAERIGGRILSIKIPEVPFVAELGAMRFIPDRQILMQGLVDELKIKTANFQFDDTEYKLRGKRVKVTDFPKWRGLPHLYPYKIEEKVERKSPTDLIVLAIQRVLRDLDFDNVEEKALGKVKVQHLRRRLERLSRDIPDTELIDKFSPPEWRLIKQHGMLHGKPLYKLGFWDLVQKYLNDEEAYNLANDGSGYQSVLSMWNAADAFAWYLWDFASSKFATLVDGMTEMITRLGTRITAASKMKNPIRLGWELQEIKPLQIEGKEHFHLTFEIGGFVTKAAKREHKRVLAEKVILALPQPALKKIQFTGLVIDKGDPHWKAVAKFQQMLDSVTANALFKAFAFYEKPWWRKDNSSFRVYTDLPLRQIYHFGTKRQCPKLKTRHNRSMCALLLYSDGRYADYWAKLEEARGQERSYDQDFAAGLTGPDHEDFHRIVDFYGAGKVLEERVHEYLKSVTSLDAPSPTIIILKHWSTAPTYAGWHTWKMGLRSADIATSMIQPFLDAEIYTCGEAFSAEQGWIEGALTSSERVLDRLGLRLPRWIDKKAYKEQKELWL